MPFFPIENANGRQGLGVDYLFFFLDIIIEGVFIAKKMVFIYRTIITSKYMQKYFSHAAEITFKFLKAVISKAFNMK